MSKSGGIKKFNRGESHELLTIASMAVHKKVFYEKNGGFCPENFREFSIMRTDAGGMIALHREKGDMAILYLEKSGNGNFEIVGGRCINEQMIVDLYNQSHNDFLLKIDQKIKGPLPLSDPLRELYSKLNFKQSKASSSSPFDASIVLSDNVVWDKGFLRLKPGQDFEDLNIKYINGKSLTTVLNASRKNLGIGGNITTKTGAIPPPEALIKLVDKENQTVEAIANIMQQYDLEYRNIECPKMLMHFLGSACELICLIILDALALKIPRRIKLIPWGVNEYLVRMFLGFAASGHTAKNFKRKSYQIKNRLDINAFGHPIMVPYAGDAILDDLFDHAVFDSPSKKRTAYNETSYIGFEVNKETGLLECKFFASFQIRYAK